MAREDGFFDDLARGLADGTLTRGKAIRLMGAAVVGGALGSLGISGEAGADPPGCKRNGKHCTRNDQCCSLNCASGSCQAQATTTTTSTSTSTSTTTPTTSTSTSTTSTSTTTTMCLPDFSTPCTADTQCCSGVCGFQGPGSNTLCVACRGPGAICTANTQCCGVSSVTRGTCVNGRCCSTSECNANLPCCPGSSCFNGVCRS